MAPVAFEKPVEDSVPKIDGAVAVGEDLEFQKRWWRFERTVWVLFALILVADVLGLFGRGYLAKAELHPADGTFDATYERIERSGTPSIMTISIGPSAIHDGHVQLFVTENLIQKLGTQRIAPQPSNSVIGNGGITYTFPVSTTPAVVELALQPSFVGRHSFIVQVPGFAPALGHVIVLP